MPRILISRDRASMDKKTLLFGVLCAAGVYTVWSNLLGRAADPLDAPARALEASRGATLPAPVLLWENGAPNAKGDSEEDKPAIYPFLPAKEKATGCGIIV